jgi:hypothetical protein
LDQHQPAHDKGRGDGDADQLPAAAGRIELGKMQAAAASPGGDLGHLAGLERPLAADAVHAAHGPCGQHLGDPNPRRLTALSVHSIDYPDRLSRQRFGEPPVGMVS